ncbi:uncharacterized protein CDAR_488401 [Caerostris darwini]|uniref:Uncharacterized protein n=1 Tax=Caerostris darwini TaxID=1538125 RepID=A0AAV4PXS4_9ARAC|nr:uncharacterized protein CDAR_488401 [Caerostris darwini]
MSESEEKTDWPTEEEEKAAEAASSSKVETDDLLGSFSAVSEKVKDLGMRVCEVLTEQEEMQNALQKMKEEISEGVVEQSPLEEKTLLEFPEDYHFTEQLQTIMDGMQTFQKAWIDHVKIMSKAETGIKGNGGEKDVWKDMYQHLKERLKYIDSAKVLLQGPLVEEPPPPPPPEVEPPPPEEEKVDKKKGKKDKKKK